MTSTVFAKGLEATGGFGFGLGFGFCSSWHENTSDSIKVSSRGKVYFFMAAGGFSKTSKRIEFVIKNDSRFFQKIFVS
ncbi:hypothetical protein C943_00749 [Mariniradius saccharolyticus AK6]|uniref:Uncharacterized protein n=1 Tax=Mariniradius saccharolyticus AK6 TaxID=1239962 RepID=M7XCY7_9BACT|nr:hypothetical protein C943_00749 [Mariniradius saccharolyticus AK6]